MKQAPSSIFMVRPEHFGFNLETAESNAFQTKEILDDSSKIKASAVLQGVGKEKTPLVSFLKPTANCE